MHPVDTLKAKIQVVKPASSNLLLHLFRETMKKEGIAGLYRGYSVHILGSIPAAGLYFGSYEFFKQRTLQIDFFSQHPFVAYLSGGMFAEAVACLIFVPVDVIKERRQVQSMMGFKYTSDYDAIRHTVAHEGVRGLYKAYGATVLSFGPFSALGFNFYEMFKGLCV